LIANNKEKLLFVDVYKYINKNFLFAKWEQQIAQTQS